MHPFRGRLTLCSGANHTRAARREAGMSSAPHCAIAYVGLIALRAYDLFEVLAIFAHDYILGIFLAQITPVPRQHNGITASATGMEPLTGFRGLHQTMMPRARAGPTVGGSGLVRLHLPSAWSFGYFSIKRKVTEKKSNKSFGYSSIMRISVRERIIKKYFFIKKKYRKKNLIFWWLFDQTKSNRKKNSALSKKNLENGWVLSVE